MTPPSASASYDSDYAKGLMQDLDSAPGLLRRALTSLLLLLAAFMILGSVLSYSPFDSTGDTAGLGDVQNALGKSGAGLANFLMQFIGFGALIAGCLCLYDGVKGLVWPARSSRKDRWGRFGLATATTLFGAAALSGIPIPQSWPMASGMGGWIGDGIFLNLKAGFDVFNIPISGFIAALIVFLVAAFCLAKLLRVVSKDFLDIWEAVLLVWATIRVWFDRLANWVRARFAKTYVAEVEQPDSIATLIRDIPDEAPTEQPAYVRQSTIAPIIRPVTQPVAADAAPLTAAPKKRKRTVKPKKPEFHFPDGADYVLPEIGLLKTPPPRKVQHDDMALRRASEDLHRVMEDYGIKGEMGAVRPGPVVTLFEFEPAPGVKSQRVINLSADIARNMSAESARIAVVPGRNAMGVELPNRRRETVWLKNMLASEAYVNSEAGLPLIMGEDIGGTAFVADLSKMPHLLVAGTTGSGKSVAINAMILSLMYKLTPEQCKFIMIDPKMLELSVYDGIPHLLTPVVTEPKKAVVALKWTVREMEDRYRKMAKMGVRNMAGYNEKVNEAKRKGKVMTRTVMTGYDKESGEPTYETEELNFEPMPFIVVIIDEMADLMMVAGKDIEGTVQRLAQMARAAGIHMIMATQRPSVDVITGTIKANFPTRVAFRVGSSIDSRTILGETGAEQLLGNGDMLFMGTGRPRRLHGPFITDSEVEKIAAFSKAQGTPSYLEEITAEPEESIGGDSGGEGNSLFDQAVAIVAKDRKASTSYIQRRLSIGYNRAANLIEKMETEGMIGPSGAGGKREIFLPEHGGF